MTEIYFFLDENENAQKEELSALAKRFVKLKAFEKTGAEHIMLKNENGKPFFKDLPDFHFNISHSKNALAIAFSDFAVGVDTEKLRKADLRVAERFFSKEEKEYINQNPDRNFFEIWTKKEAYIKKNGLSLKNIGSAKTKGIPTYFIKEYAISVCCDDKEEIIIHEQDLDVLWKILENFN